jgi:hypothetical protein
MPNQTTNYGLIKPLDNETADIGVINQNMDTIDSQLNVIEGQAGQNNNELSAHKADITAHTGPNCAKKQALILGNFSNSMDKQECVLDFDGDFGGTIKITLASGWNNGNASGSISKIFNLSVSSSFINYQNNSYRDVSSATAQCFSISEVYLENNKWHIKIIKNSGNRNGIIITIEAYATSSLNVNIVNNLVINEPVPSIETFVTPYNTGQIVESGSNANGKYIRFEDGTQICWENIAFNTAGLNVLLPFPAVFSSNIISCSISGTKGAGQFTFSEGQLTDLNKTIVAAHENTQWGIRTYPAGTSTDLGIGLTAIGRWK